MDTKYLYPKNPKPIKYPIYPFLHKLSDYKAFYSYYKSESRENRLKTKLEALYKGSNIILTNSGSSALKLALICLGIQPNDEVMLSNFNCPNVIDAVLNLSAKPVFVDIDEDFSLSFDDIRKKRNEKTKAIILTHLYGLKENIKIIYWAKDNGIYVIDDGAQAMFTTQNNKFVGGNGDIGILSFGLTKPLSSIGGGALIIKNEDILRRLPKLNVETKEEVYEDYKRYFKSWFLFKLNNNYILSKLNNIWSKLLKMPKTYTSKLDVLPKSITLIEPKKMNPIRKELLLIQLNRLKGVNEHNKANYNEMNECLRHLEAYGIKLIHLDKGESPNYYTLIFPDENYRYDCSVYLSKKGIQTCWNYIPLDEIPIYSEYKSYTRNVDYVWGRVLSIPFKYPLVSKDIRYISLQLNEYLDRTNSFRYKGDQFEIGNNL